MDTIKRPSRAVVFYAGESETDKISEQYSKDVQTTIFELDKYINQFKTLLREIGYDEKDVYEIKFSNYKETVQKIVGPPNADTLVMVFCDGSETDGCIGKTMNRYLEEEGYLMVGSTYKVGYITQSKHLQKMEYKKNGVNTSPWILVQSWNEVEIRS